MSRSTITALVVVVGLLLLADLLVVNASLGELAQLAVDATVLVAGGAALTGVAALGWRRAGDLWRRRGDPIGAGLVLLGMLAMVIAGLRPGSQGSEDPAVAWLLGALLIPIGATLFGLLFVTTLLAARRSLTTGRRDALLVVGAAIITLALLLPIGGTVGAGLEAAAGWTLDVPIAAVFRGLLIGIALVAALVAARILLGIGAADD